MPSSLIKNKQHTGMFREKQIPNVEQMLKRLTHR